MNKKIRRILYRVFCMLSAVIGIYLIVDLIVSGTLDIKMIVVFVLLMILIMWSVADWKWSNALIENQEKELKTYQLYIQPMEELVKEIRAIQHDYDNHLNAILNMHLTVDNYEELVKRQSEYIYGVRSDSGAGRYLSLLRISDRVLAGFLYSKIVSSPENVKTDVEVRNWKVISRVSEHSLIEIVGVLVDNAYEATLKVGGRVRILLDSKEDCLVFDVWNQYPKTSMEDISRFFESGYTTKTSNGEKHGIGLARAKKLTQRFGGELTVGQEEVEGVNYIHFSLFI